MKGIFDKDITIKIISGLIAIFLWFYVLDIQNPETEILIKDIPINIIGSDTISSHGLFLLSQKDETINIKVAGRRKSLVELSNKNIMVSADISALNKVGEYLIPLQIDLPIDNATILDRKPYNMTIYIDKMIEVQKPVNIATKGNIKEPYILLEPQIKPNVITLKGPSSIMKDIYNLKVTIDITNQSKDIVSLQKYDILNIYGEKINSPKISAQVEMVEVIYPVIKTKELEVTPQLIGDLPEDYELANIKVASGPITLAGKDDLIEEISEIYTEPISINDTINSFTIDTPIIIPEGLRLIDSEDIANVKIDIEKATIQEILIDNISIENIANGLSYELKEKEVKIKIKGIENQIKKLKTQIESLDSKNTYAYIDLENIREGEHSLPIRIKGYPDIKIVEGNLVNITISTR